MSPALVTGWLIFKVVMFLIGCIASIVLICLLLNEGINAKAAIQNFKEFKALCSYVVGLVSRRFEKPVSLDFELPYKYTLSSLHKFPKDDVDYRELTIKMPSEILKGILIIGMRADGIWDYYRFTIQDIGSGELKNASLGLKQGTNLLNLRKDLKEIKDLFDEQNIKVEFSHQVGSIWHDMEAKINNLKALESAGNGKKKTKV